MSCAGCGEQGSRRQRSACPGGVLSRRAPRSREGHVVVLVLVAGLGAAKGRGCPQEATRHRRGRQGFGCWQGRGAGDAPGAHGCRGRRCQHAAPAARAGREGEKLPWEPDGEGKCISEPGAEGICRPALFGKGLARGESRELCSDAYPGAKVVPRPDFTSRHCRGKASGLIDEELSSHRPCHPQG